jgi:HEAT repeat protein
VVKFLRRSQPEEPELSDQSLKVYEGLPIPKTKEPDIQAISGAVLRKIDILQNKQKKLRMLKTIARLRLPWVSAVLLELLSSPNEDIRDTAVKELAQRDDWPVQKIYQQLARPPWYAKSAALRILSLKKYADAARHIRLVLDDPNVDVRRSAAGALGEIGGQEARSLLVRMAKDSNLYVRRAAQEALDKVCDLKFS